MPSIVRLSGHVEVYCGYCKQERKCTQYMMEAVQLDIHDYQELMDKGWRRSGKQLYRPDVKKVQSSIGLCVGLH